MSWTLGAHSAMFLLGARIATRDIVKIAPWFPFNCAQKKLAKYKRDNLNKKWDSLLQGEDFEGHKSFRRNNQCLSLQKWQC